MLDSPEGVCAGQARFEYPPTSVPFSTFWNPAFHQLGVEWDNGSHLMMVLEEGVDRVRLIGPALPPENIASTGSGPPGGARPTAGGHGAMGRIAERVI
jgi:hypothetical protein